MKHFSFQNDVEAESPEILEIGLLFAEYIDDEPTNPPKVFSFQHKLIQEFLAAVYIKDINADVLPAFLDEALATWKKIENHREVLHFACSMLGKDGASPLINHLGKILSKHTMIQLNEGRTIPDEPMNPPLTKDLPLLSSFQRASSMTSINPFITSYPECGKPLAEVLANTEVVVITDILKNDPLQLSTSPANVFLNELELESELEYNEEEVERLLTALGPIHDNIVAVSLNQYTRAIFTHVRHFSGLKLLSIRDAEHYDMNWVASCISSLGVNPPLMQIMIKSFSRPDPEPDINQTSQSLMAALSGCTHLRNLIIEAVNLHGNLSKLMTSPPPRLRELTLHTCDIDAEDVGHIGQAFREDKLTCLEKLNIKDNPIGESGVRSLLQATSTTSHALSNLDLGATGVDEEGRVTVLSEQFVNDWREKLTNIEVKWKFDYWDQNVT